MTSPDLTHLVLVLKENEDLYIGESRLQLAARSDGRIRVFIEAPRTVAVRRGSAKKVPS